MMNCRNLHTTATNMPYPSTHPVSTTQMKKKTDLLQHHTGSIRSVLSTKTSQHTKLPSMIEVRRLNTKIVSTSRPSTSVNILKFIYTCIVETMRIMNDYLLWNPRSNKNSGGSIDHTTTVISNELLGEQNKNNNNESNLKLNDGGDDDDVDIDKLIFRQEMESLKIIIRRKNKSNNDGCRGNTSYNCTRIHRNTMHQENSRLADKILRQHFVHANYLQQIQQPISP